jgi:2-O-methyltransferase
MELAYVQNLISLNPVIFEIGCADGKDTKEFLKMGKVYGFEPEPNNIKLLKELKGLELFEGVVSDIDGEIDFNRSRTSDPEALRLSGSIQQPKNHLKIWDWIYFDESIKVKSIRLDTFAKDIPYIDFIWCDSQGAEERIIKGGSETLKKTKFFYTEYTNNEQYEGQATLGRLRELLPDFEMVIDFGTDVLFKNKNIS